MIRHLILTFGSYEEALVGRVIFSYQGPAFDTIQEAMMSLAEQLLSDALGRGVIPVMSCECLPHEEGWVWCPMCKHPVPGMWDGEEALHALEEYFATIPTRRAHEGPDEGDWIWWEGVGQVMAEAHQVASVLDDSEMFLVDALPLNVLKEHNPKLLTAYESRARDRAIPDGMSAEDAQRKILEHLDNEEVAYVPHPSDRK